MRITQWGEYGVHCCIFIAEKQLTGASAVNAAEIADSQGIQLDYAQQILQRLRKNNIIESVRGPSGGYKLTKPSNQITLKDILTAAEGETFEVICEAKPIHGERCAQDHACGLRSVWHEFKQHVDSFLTQKTLENIVKAQMTSNKLNAQNQSHVQITKLNHSTTNP